MLSIDGCLTRIMGIPGTLRVTLVDCATGLAIAAAGREDRVDRHEDAAGATDVVRAVLATPVMSATRMGDGIEEIIVCGSAGYHLLFLVTAIRDEQLFFHLLIDRDKGNLALARLRLQTLMREMAGSEHA